MRAWACTRMCSNKQEVKHSGPYGAPALWAHGSGLSGPCPIGPRLWPVGPTALAYRAYSSALSGPRLWPIRPIALAYRAYYCGLSGPRLCPIGPTALAYRAYSSGLSGLLLWPIGPTALPYGAHCSGLSGPRHLLSDGDTTTLMTPRTTIAKNEAISPCHAHTMKHLALSCPYHEASRPAMPIP